MDYIEEKILGCLVGAAAGDALGAATEMRTRRQIEEKFGGRVKEFLTPPDDTFARGNMPGQVTDDFSLAYVTCLEILRHNGEITPEVSRAALLSWAEYDDFFRRFAGPTTRAAVEEDVYKRQVQTFFARSLCIKAVICARFWVRKGSVNISRRGLKSNCPPLIPWMVPATTCSSISFSVPSWPLPYTSTLTLSLIHI